MVNPMVTVCSPVHNEEGNLAELIGRITAALEAKYPGEWEYLLVNDCSTDASLAVMEKITATNPAVRIISHEHNQGERAAWQTAFREAHGEVVTILAADLQSLPEAVPSLISLILTNGYDVGTGQRKNRTDNWFYVLATFFLTLYARIFFRVRVRDVSSSFFAVRACFVKDLKMVEHDHRYILPIFRRRNARIKEIPIAHASRKIGHSHYTYGKVLRAIPQTARFTLRYFTGYYDLPEDNGELLSKVAHKLLNR